MEASLNARTSGFMAKDQEARVISDLIQFAAGGEVVLCPASANALRGGREA